MVQEGIAKIKSAALQWTIARHDFVKSKNKMFLTFCFCFIAGASSFSFFESKKVLLQLYILIFIILFLVIIFWHKKLQRFLFFCLLIFILGGVRFLFSIPEKGIGRIEFYNGQKKIVYGFVAREPDIGVSDARYIVRVEGLSGLESAHVTGNILVKTRIYPQYAYGEVLQIECSLQEPKNFEGSTFNYAKYLAKQGVWSICSNPKIKVLEGNSGNLLIKIMLDIKNSIKIQMARLWPEPDNSLMAGILYGSRSGLPQEMVDNFSRTGVSHITAVSGYNVTIIAIALNSVLIYFGLFRRQSFWVLVSLILAFVFFTGASASVVRAGIMAIIVLVSGHIGRLSAISKVLVYAVVTMLAINPYLLVWDAGFQLSFLSTLGLVYLSPIFQYYVDKKIKINNSFLASGVEVFITTIAAIITTLPLIMYQFGRVSIVAPVVNMLILWIIPWLMLFGFMALVISFVFFPIGQLIGWFTEFGIRYTIIVIDWFGVRNWSAVELRVPLWFMALFYLLIVLFVAKKYQKALGR